MSRIELSILYAEGNLTKTRVVVNKWKFQDSMMGEQFISFNVTSEKPIAWAVGDYCVFRGVTFTLNYIPSVTQKARTGEIQDAYTYENVKFESQQEELTRILMLDITPTTGDYVAALGTNYTGSSKFQLFCGETTANGRTLTAVCALAAKMQANLDRAYPRNGWHIYVDTTSTYTNASGNTVLVTHTEDKVMSFDNTTVAQALSEVHNTFDLDYCVKGRNIYIGYNLKNLTSDYDDETFVWGYGKGYPTRENSGKALFQIKRMSNQQQKLVTRLRALGSTKNLPYRYYNKKYSLSQSLFPTNLQLPDTFEVPSVKDSHNAERDAVYGVNPQTGLPYLRHVKGDTNDAYIDKNDDAESCPEGMREDSARWDGSNGDLPEIYPTIEEATYGELRGALVKDQDGHTGGDAFPSYGNDERVDELLAIGYKSGATMVDDANKGDGILPDSGTTDSGTPVPATIGQTSVYYADGGGEFEDEGGYYAGPDRTLFTIQDVQPGNYAMVPTGASYNSVIYGFNISYYKDGISADVGYKIKILQRAKETGVLTTIATYTSDYVHAVRSDQITEMALPELPDVKNGNNAKVTEIAVTEFSDILVVFAPVMRSVVVPNNFIDDFALVYKVGMSRLDTSNEFDPEYTWKLLDDSESQEEIFHVFVKDMGFDISACWSDGTPVVAMKSGRCVGREFEIGENIEKVTYNGRKGYMLTLHRAKDSSLNTYYPSATDPIEAGDNFVLLGIEMPEAYIKMAEVRLLRAATDYLADNCETQFTYQPYIDDIYLQRNYDNMVAAGTPQNSIFWRLYAGLKFTFRGIPSSEDEPLPLVDLTIEQVSISMGEGLTPQVEMTLNDDVQQTTLQKLTTSVDRIYNGSLFGSGRGGTSVGANAAALLNILQTDGGKMFLSKRYDDTAEGKITFNDVDTHNAMSKFKKGLRVGNFQSRLLGSGAIVDENGNAEFESIYSRNFISTPEFRFNRVNVTEGEQWCTNGYGTIKEVEIIDDTTGYITLQLEENDYASIAPGDICRGIYNDIASEHATANLDDDSILYDGSGNPREGTGFGFSAKDGFFTSYFFVKQMIVNKKGECKFIYELRNSSTPHPCDFMKFAQYGSFTDSSRRSSSYATSIGHYYEMVLDGVSTWRIKSSNVVYRKGWLGDMTVTLKNGNEVELQGYGLYCQDNVYFGNALVQLDPLTLKDIEEMVKNYVVTFSDHVDVITVDDVGNAIGGLYTEDDGVINYRIQAAITVRNNNKILLVAADDADAAEGTYKIYAQPVGCTCKVEDSTLYITSIDNIKDGVAGSEDDTDFDYDAMRDMDSCRVDIIVDCEGKASIVKSFPVTIKHSSQPFVHADISNENSVVSWSTKTQSYIGLPITFGIQMWHNDEFLDIADTSDIDIIPLLSGLVFTKSIYVNEYGAKVALVNITALPNDLSPMTKLSVSVVGTYAGVRYERTLMHIITKNTDTNVYSLLPSVNEIVRNPNTNVQSANSITCSVACDSSEDKHYFVPYEDFVGHRLLLAYRMYYNDGSADANERLYGGDPVGIGANVSKIRFTLYGTDEDGTPDDNIIHDTEEIHVILHGKNGAGGDSPIAKYKWFPQSTGVTLTREEETSDLNYETYGWSDTAPNREEGQEGWFLWMTQSQRYADGTLDHWSAPVRISGEKGSPGEDGKDREWIYRLNDNTGFDGASGDVDGVPVSGDARFTTDDFVPTGWLDHPSGIGQQGDSEYASWRDFDNDTQRWGAFHTPIIWSHYGERGMDGDGVEYVFALTETEVAPTITESGDTYQGKTYLDDEYLPLVSTGARATDDPSGTTSTYKFEWVAKRSKGNAVNGVRTWEQYSGTMSLWSKYATDGDTPINVYRWTTSKDTAPKISGYNYPPSSWSKTPPNRPGDGYFLWMSTNTRHGDGTIGEWSSPIRISGEDGTPGEDAADREWIYYRSSSADYGNEPSTITTDKDGTSRTAEYIATTDDFVPLGWTDNPLGVDSGNKYEYASFRDKERGESTWGAFSTPILWSHYGERGMDGDGVEYVFMRTNTDTPPRITNNSDWTETVDGQTVVHTFTDDEYLPMTNEGRATDDPVGTDSTHKYEWVAKRTKGEAVNGVRQWLPYATGNMKLWANFSEDGVSQPSYTQSQEAWSNVPSVASATTEPTPNGGWSDGTPANNAGYAYLWRRTRLMVLNAVTKEYAPQSNSWTYTRLSGTNGTSITPKGSVVAIAELSSNFPMTGVSTGSLAILDSDNQLFKYNGSSWTQSGMGRASDGDCYVVSESCSYLGEDVKGHMFMYSSEATEWVDLGQFKGENGVSYFTHIAWADDITVVNGVPTAAVGFTTGIGDSADDGKNWMGICIDENPNDPANFAAYKWKYVKGRQGEDSSEREWIYYQSNSSTPPSIPTQTAANKATDGYVPTNWSDHPHGVSVPYPYEYTCYRDKERGETTWGDFQGINGSPLLWSHYGEKGADGDGVEYVFIRTKENTAPTIYSDGSYNDSNGHAYSADEHLPRVATRTDIESDNSGNASKPYECTDDPKGTDSTWKYEWVAKRTKTLQSDGKTRIWDAYSGSMSLWANWSKDGASQPSYLHIQEAWSNSTTDPTEDVQESEWSDTTPVKNRTYLWRRSRLMMLNDDGTSYVPQGSWTYARISGTNGTSIDPKGSVVFVSATRSGLPSTGASANDLAIVVTSAKLYKYNNGWTQVANSSSDGDCYVVTKDCTYGGVNVINHMFLWSDEAQKWIDLGQFKGDDGKTYYTHIAWADVVIFSGQTVVSVSGFSPGVGQNNEEKPWMGILVNQNPEDNDPPTSYKWKYVKGEQGLDSSEREWIYCLSNSPVAPNVPASSGMGSVNGNATAYSNTLDKWVPSGWVDNPKGVDENHKYEYSCWRDKGRGSSTWSGFQGANGKAILWSHYGDRGTDGDGVEYVFVRTSDKVVPEVYYPSSGYVDSNGAYAKDDEFLPLVRVPIGCQLSGNGRPTTESVYNMVECTDDPRGISSEWPYEWVIKRSKAAAVEGVREWNQYQGTMSLWANWSSSPYMLDLTNEQSFVNCDNDGVVLPNAVYESTGIMLFLGTQQAFSEFNILITPVNITCNGHTSAYTIDGATAQRTDGVILLTPSAITANTAGITVKATNKNNSSIVLEANYKINKNIAGGFGINAIMYSLVPSLNVIHKNDDGTYRDTTLSVVVNKIDGEDVSPLTSVASLNQEGLTLSYQGSHSTEQVVNGNMDNLSTATLCGSALFTKIFLRKSDKLLDSERINVVKDGETTPLYSILADPDNVTIPSDVSTATYSGVIRFRKRIGEEESDVSWYSRIFVRKQDGTRRAVTAGSVMTGYGSTTSPFTVAVDTDCEVIEVYCIEQANASKILTDYVVKKEIVVNKHGDGGPKGEDADFHTIEVTGSNFSSTDSPSVDIDGTNVVSDHNFTRGLTLVVLNKDMTVFFKQTYDVYLDGVNQVTSNTDALMAALNEYAPKEKIAVLLSSDAIFVHDRLWAKLGCEYGVGRNIVTPASRTGLAIVCQKGMVYGTAFVSITEDGSSAYVKASVASGVLVSSMQERPVVGDNLLRQTDFKSLSAWNQHNGNVIHGGYSGCNSFECTSNPSTAKDVLEQVVSGVNDGMLNNDTWYTLSFYSRGGAIRTFVYPFGVNNEEKCYIDGVESTAYEDGLVGWPSSGEYTLHSFTFKTRPVNQYMDYYSPYNTYQKYQIAAVNWQLLGNYSSTTSYSYGAIVKSGNNYYYSRVNSNRNHTPSSSSSYWFDLGRRSEGYFGVTRYYLSLEVNNSNKSFVDTTYWREVSSDDTSMTTGQQKFADAVRVLWRKLASTETTYISKLKLEEGLVPTTWQSNEEDRKGESGEGVFVRDRGIWESGQTYIYGSVNGLVYRDMVRHDIGGNMYGFLVKNANSMVTSAPTSASGDENWESSGIIKTIIANTLFGTDANIGGFMVSRQTMISTATDPVSGNPMLILNGEGGDAVFKGAIYANNFYHGVCINGKETVYYCTSDFIASHDTEAWIGNFSVGSYYTLEKIEELSSGDVSSGSGMIACTYSADIVLIPNRYNNTSPRRVVLPCAKDFEGKIVEIHDCAYTNGQSIGNIVVASADNGRFSAGIGSTGASDGYLGTSATLSPGSVGRFISIKDDGFWYWVRLS